MDETPSSPLEIFPTHLPRPARRDVRHRARQIVSAAARHFTPVVWRQARGHAEPTVAWAAPLRRTFQDVGATFTKFGQLISSSPGVFGEDVSAEFRDLLDTGPPVPFEHVKAAIETDLGRPLGTTFATFEREPIAAASIAVVHAATLRDGRKVAVKVLRPGIEAQVACDLGLIAPLIDLLAKQIGVGAAGWLLQLVDGFRTQVAEELDLRNEARALTTFGKIFADLGTEAAVVPEPYPDAGGRSVLTMEFLDGIPVDDLNAIAQSGADPRPLVREMVRVSWTALFRHGVFHGDVHAGNIMLTPDGRLAMLDWGIVGRLTPETHRFFRRMIQGGLGDESAWDDIAKLLVEAYGSTFRDVLGMDDAELGAWLRGMIEPVFTSPWGEMSLGDFILAPQREVAKVQGEKLQHGTLRRIIANRREISGAAQEMVDTGALGSDFDRSLFLLGKQMLYFERYGRMFMSDLSIIDDRDLLEALVAD